MIRIGVVGGGTVGTALARCFLEHADVRVYDVMPQRRTHSLMEALYADLIFICLPTPQKPDSLEADTSAIDDFFRLQRGSKLNWVLRSTVPIGTTRRLREEYALPNLIHSPEFLTARVSLIDAIMPARNIIGGPECEATGELTRLYYHRFPGVPVYHMTSDESEAVKLICNGFFTAKVVFFSTMRELADKLGLDWEAVMEGVMSCGRIAHSHVSVPGPSGKRFAGGHCLPKDFANLTDCFEKAGLGDTFLRAMHDYNRRMWESQE